MGQTVGHAIGIIGIDPSRNLIILSDPGRPQFVFYSTYQVVSTSSGPSIAFNLFPGYSSLKLLPGKTSRGDEVILDGINIFTYRDLYPGRQQYARQNNSQTQLGPQQTSQQQTPQMTQEEYNAAAWNVLRLMSENE